MNERFEQPLEVPLDDLVTSQQEAPVGDAAPAKEEAFDVLEGLELQELRQVVEKMEKEIARRRQRLLGRQSLPEIDPTAEQVQAVDVAEEGTDPEKLHPPVFERARRIPLVF